MNECEQLGKKLKSFTELYVVLNGSFRKAEEQKQTGLMGIVSVIKVGLEKEICKTYREYTKAYLDSLQDSEIKGMLGPVFLYLENHASSKNSRSFYIS